MFAMSSGTSRLLSRHFLRNIGLSLGRYTIFKMASNYSRTHRIEPVKRLQLIHYRVLPDVLL